MPADPPVIAIEAAIIGYLQAIVGLEDALDHEPRSLPRALPVATLLLTRTDPEQIETGIGEDVTYEWRLSIYVALQDWGAAQQELKRLVPVVLSAIRAKPTCSGLVDMLTVRDSGAEPIFSDDGYVRKSLTLRAVLTET